MSINRARIIVPCFFLALTLGAILLILWQTRNNSKSQFSISNITVSPITTNKPVVTTTPEAKFAQGQSEAVRQVLSRTWESYKGRFIEPDGRTVDRMREDVTTSEGQSYTMLRAVWQNDPATFERVRNWTTRNLGNPRGDNLFGSLWGKDKAGRWAVQDKSSNSGADQDIALAVLMAARRWPEKAEGYQKQSQAILNDLWSKSVITIGGKPYLTAGDWALSQPQPTLNPSYFAPYAYRLFAQFDTNPAHNWNGLLEASFEALYGCTALNEPSRLPPDWCTLEPRSGTYKNPQNNLSVDYGYQAFRVYWRLALDDQWNGAQDGRSRAFLQWSSQGRNPLTNLTNSDFSGLAATYDRTGTSVAPPDSATWAGALGLFQPTNPTVAATLYQKMLRTYHDLDNGVYYFWDEPNNFYQQNWLWFGVALYGNFLKSF